MQHHRMNILFKDGAHDPRKMVKTFAQSQDRHLEPLKSRANGTRSTFVQFRQRSGSMQVKSFKNWTATAVSLCIASMAYAQIDSETS